jgi:hypothetical protein
MAVDFSLLPDRVDPSIVGSGSAIGAVVGGLWAYFLGYSLNEIVSQGALVALLFGALAVLAWLFGTAVQLLT